MKGITIRGKVGGKFEGVSSLVKPKDVQEDVNKYVNEDDFVREYVNDNDVINEDFANDISVVRKFPKKVNKTALSIEERDV
ncbi:hypothetical protein RYX36_003893 [Vicia faba]